MKARLRKGLALLGLGTLVTIAVGLYPRFVGRNRLRFPYLSGPIATAEYQRLAALPGWKPARLAVAPGVGLNGLVRRPAAENAPWVLYFPGNDATQLARGQAFLSRLRAEQDWGLAVFAYRGYDSSDGTPTISDLAADAPNIVLELCKAEKLTPSRMHVIGFSIGGYLAVRATSALTAAQEPPASLTLLASVNDIVMVRNSRWAKLDPGDDLRTQPFLAEVREPVLIVQGGADETLGGPVQGKAIASTLGQRARYVELPGVGHNSLIKSEAAVQEVRAFIAGHGK
jgi:pimeloyl-ACP methyl ester carboxylesterase